MTIRQIQLLLLYLGYAPGEADGVDGPQTREAVRQFQMAFGGIEADGRAGEQTQKALKHAVVYGNLRKDPDFWAEIPNFRREEFACKCGGRFCDGFPVQPEEKLVRAIQKVRNHFGVAVTISSGVRCEKHNQAVGGVSNSRHLGGKAVDFCVRGFSAVLVLDYVKSLPEIRYSYAIDSNFVHMDIS